MIIINYIGFLNYSNLCRYDSLFFIFKYQLVNIIKDNNNTDKNNNYIKNLISIYDKRECFNIERFGCEIWNFFE